MAEYDDVMQILNDNSDKTFVKRILNPTKYPVLKLKGGRYATHKMAWAEIDTPEGPKAIVYPTVLYDGKILTDYGKEALPMVLKTGSYIEFDDPKQADWFSKKYKLAWSK